MTTGAPVGCHQVDHVPHYYYVRPDLPDHDAVVAGIRSVDYTWPVNGKQATDYAPR